MNVNEFFGSTIGDRGEDAGPVTGVQGYMVSRALNQECLTAFGQVSGVTSGVTVDVASVLVPQDEDWYLQRVAFSGDNSATYELQVDSVILDRVHVWFGANLSGQMDFTGFPSYGKLVTRGSLIVVKVVHSRPYVGQFNARIQWVVRKTPVAIGQGSTAFSDP